MLYLNNPLLNIEGLIGEFNKDVMRKGEPKPPAPSLLNQFKKKLLSIYYPNTTVSEFNPAVIQRDRRFETYPELKHALSYIFSSDNKEEISAQLARIPASEERPGNATAQWVRLNRELGYFEDDRLLPLFTELASACRAMSALIEDNLADEDMPYIYAYRLMVLFADQTKTTSFKDIAEKTYALLNQANAQQKNTPYHDVILNLIQLPPKSGVNDLGGWLKHIQSRIGIAFLPYFGMAPQIEAQNEGNAPATLRDAKSMAARCYYTRASENLELAELCKAYNIPEDGDECSFNKCLDYLKSLPNWPMKERDNLPHPVIIGSGAAEGYSWVKLPTDDLRALILGRITACCQSIGGHSEQCVKDAVTLSDNGLYVLLKRKDRAVHNSHPYVGNKINDADFEIVGQSYAWISKTGNLTLDSLECSKGRVTTSVAKALLTQLANTVLRENEFIKRVTLGAGGGTPEDLEFDVAIPEKMRTGYDYGDSREQYCIARNQKIPNEQLNALMSKIKLEYQLRKLKFDPQLEWVFNYLSDYLSDTSHFEEELEELLVLYPDLSRKLITSNHNLDTSALFRLILLTPTPSLKDLRPVDLDSLEKLSEEEKKQALSQMTLARLFWEELTPEEFLKRLNYISVEERLRVVQAHKGILRRAAYNSELLVALLRICPKTERLEFIKEKDNYGDTVLHTAASNPDLLKAILAIYPEEERFNAIKEKNMSGRTVLHLAAGNPESLIILLALLPEAERLELIKEKDDSGNTVLHLAAGNPESLKILLALLPEVERLELIKEKDNGGRTVLHLAAGNPESLIILFALLPKVERLKLIKEKDMFGKTVLYTAAPNPESLKILLALLPEVERLELIKEKDNGGRTVLHFADNPESLKTLISIYPKEELLELIKEKDMFGNTVLHLAARNNPESLKTLFSIWSKEELLDFIKEKDNGGRTVLHFADNPESLKTLISIYPKEELLELIKEKDMFGKTVLYTAAPNPESLKILLDFLPEAERLELIKEQDKGGGTVLNFIAFNPRSLESLRLLLTFYPKEERLKAIKEKDMFGQTIIERTLGHAESNRSSDLEAVLNLLPQQSLKELPEKILAHPKVKKFIHEQESKESKVSQATFGIFNQQNEQPAGPKSPKPR